MVRWGGGGWGVGGGGGEWGGGGAGGGGWRGGGGGGWWGGGGGGVGGGGGGGREEGVGKGEEVRGCGLKGRCQEVVFDLRAWFLSIKQRAPDCYPRIFSAFFRELAEIFEFES